MGEPTQNASAVKVSTETKPLRVGGGVSAPRGIYAPDPEYNDTARQAMYPAVSVLWLIVDASGSPRDIRIQRPARMGLDEEAIKAVQTWRFEPARKGGEAVPVMISVEVNFRLY